MHFEDVQKGSELSFGMKLEVLMFALLKWFEE
jgi:hypothetical protein